MASVLVVDPIPSITLTLAMRLRHLGVTSERAHSLEAARDRLAAHSFEVVVLDLWAWPDGLALCESLLAGPAKGPIVITTADPDTPAIRFYQPARGRGVHEHFEKPLAIDALARRVRDLLESTREP